MKFEKLIQQLEIDLKEFNFQFQSHPNYPSALALSNTLNFLGVKNDAYELEKAYWKEIPGEFITIYKDQFSLVKKEEKDYKIFSGEELSITEKELLEHSQNFVLLFTKKEISNSTSKKPIKYNVFFLILLGLYLIYNFLQNDWVSFVFNMVSIIGVYISFEIFSEKFGITSKTLNSICGHTEKKTDSSCSKIINSDSINVFGLKLSDFSLIYFVTIVILGLLLPNTSVLLQITSWVTVVAIFYSLYIQIFVEKSSCKICLIIITLLIFQIILSRFLIAVPISSFAVLESILIFAVVFTGVIYINDLLKKNDSLGKSNLKNLKFKRNYEVFKRELITKDKINFENNKNGFFLGNQNAKLHISLVSNPYCGFCKNAHEILEKLLKNYPNQISSQIRFNLSSEKENEKLTQLIGSLKNIYETKGELKFLESLHFWFENKDEKQSNEKDSSSNYANVEELERIGKENLIHGLNFTPMFLINGNHFPDKYEREDIFYFIDELLEDEDILK